MFDIIEDEFKKENISYYKLTGQTKVADRIKLVDEFNDFLSFLHDIHAFLRSCRQLASLHVEVADGSILGFRAEELDGVGNVEETFHAEYCTTEVLAAPRSAFADGAKFLLRPGTLAPCRPHSKRNHYLFSSRSFQAQKQHKTT